MNYLIREATPEDYEGLRAVLREIEILHQRTLPDVFVKYPKPIWSKEFVPETLSNDDANLFVAESAGQIIGLLRVVIQETPDLPFLVKGRYAFIDTVVVAEAFRRAGVGKALIERAHRWAAEKNLAQIRLNVWEFNEGAIRFYEKLGYVSKTRQMWRSLPSDP
jgi:ribosomal protein S18 acetylase RimI-like enzyme